MMVRLRDYEVMTLNDRVAIVTGAGSGIGRGIAKRLAEEGVDIVVADVHREPKQGDLYDTDVTIPTDELIRDEFGVESIFVRTDVSKETDIEQLVDRTVEEYGGIDILINNAGILIPGTSQEVTSEEWQTVIDVNLTAYFLTAKHAIPHLRDSDHGRIVNISSVNARFGGSGPAYASTKAAIVNLTRDLAHELADAGVTVNSVLPGVIKTPMQDLNSEETMERQAANTPLPRLGTPRDVGNTVAFFTSDEAEWITGAQLVVDGGYLSNGY